MTYEEVMHEVFEKVYRNTDDCEMRISKECYKLIVKALEKQIPKKPHIHIMTYKSGAKREIEQCPFCWDNGGYGFWDTLVDKDTKYCRRCGQAIDWSEKDVKSKIDTK